MRKPVLIAILATWVLISFVPALSLAALMGRMKGGGGKSKGGM